MDDSGIVHPGITDFCSRFAGYPCHSRLHRQDQLLLGQFLPSAAYFISTLAPAFSSVALIFSASSFVTPSLTGLGALSTRSLASLRPSPVSARTSLITSIFFSPNEASTTVNSVFSSTGAAAAPGAAATATAAAADTPH